MKTIALFFGGPGSESVVSLMSAKNVIKYFDYKRYHLVLIYWNPVDRAFYQVQNIEKLANLKKGLEIKDFSKLFEAALLMTHGRYGEDGILQSILESQMIKYCGCGVLSSALCMDKAIFKNYLAAKKIRQTKYAVLDFELDEEKELLAKQKNILHKFKMPIYIKPANSGSSLGITRVNQKKDFSAALKIACQYDKKIVIEEGLVGPQEIEMAIIGNKNLEISEPGELRLVKDFYDYDDKYKLGKTEIIVPAKLSKAIKLKLQKRAIELYRFFACRGFARLDFFVVKNEIYVNEINTLPGFTDISMFPVLMMSKGMSYREILNKIIDLAFQ